MTRRVKYILKNKGFKDVFLKKRLQQISCGGWFVVTSKDAFFDEYKGWICDCGLWTFGDDSFHVPVVRRKDVSKYRRVIYCRRC